MGYFLAALSLSFCGAVVWLPVAAIIAALVIWYKVSLKSQHDKYEQMVADGVDEKDIPEKYKTAHHEYEMKKWLKSI